MSDTPKPPFDWNNLNLLALLSLIFSVVGFQIPGIIAGHIALVQLKTKPQSGRALAIAGLIVGYAGFALAVLAGIVFFGAWMFGMGSMDHMRWD